MDLLLLPFIIFSLVLAVSTYFSTVLSRFPLKTNTFFPDFNKSTRFFIYLLPVLFMVAGSLMKTINDKQANKLSKAKVERFTLPEGK